MRKLWIGLLVLTILLFAAVLIVPSFFDWNAHKKRIAAAVLEATGRELTIRGDIDVTILPSPGLRVADVRFANIYGAAAPDMVRLEEARISIALGPLFEGRLAAVVTLVKPIINLETLKDGRTSWELHTSAPAKKSVENGKQPAGSSGLPFDIELRNFRIVGGTVSYFDARSGLFERIGQLKSNVSFDSLAGPFRVQGEGILHGVPAEIEISTGRVTDKTPLPVSLSLRSARGDTAIQFHGQLSEPTPAGVLRGEVTATSTSPGVLVAAMTREVAPAFLSQAFALTARVDASRSHVNFNALQFNFGKARAAGVAAIAFGDVPDLKIKLNSTNLDLDGVLSGTGAKPVSDTMDRGAAVPESHSASATLPKPKEGRMLLPGNLNASIQLNADVVQFRQAVVRDVSMLGSLHKGRLTVVNAQAIMPGNSRIDAKGTVTSENNDLALDIDLRARSDNLREVVQWLGVDVSGIPADKLRRFKASTRITGTPRALSAQKFLVTLDASHITGGINLALRDRPAFGLRFVADRFNLDGYLPGRGVRGGTPAEGNTDRRPKQTDGLSKKSGESPVLAVLQTLNAFDANIDGRVKQLIVAKTPAKNLQFDITVVNGGIKVRKAALQDYAGVQGALKGAVALTGKIPSIDLDYDVRVLDRKRLMRFLGNPARLRRYLTGQIGAAGRISGSFGKISIKSRVAAMAGAIQFDGSVEQPILAPQLDLTVKATFPELAGLVRLAAPGYTPAAGKLGTVDLDFKLKGTPNVLKLGDISGTLGPMRVHGSADIDLTGERPNLSVSASASEVLLDLFLPPVRAASNVPFRGYRIIPAAAGAPPRRSRWSVEPIDLSVLSQFDGKFAVDLAAVTKAPYRLTNMKVRVAVAGGKLDITDIAADFSTGKLNATGSVGTRKDAVNAVFKLEGNNVDISDIAPVLRNYQMRLGPMRLGARMTGPVTVNLTMRASGQTEKTLISGLNGTAHLTGQVRTRLSDETRQAGALAGLAGQLLGSKVKELQQFTGVAQAPGRLSAAFDGPATLNGDFDIEQGIIRTDNLVLVGAKGRALTTGRAELSAWRLSSQTDVTLASQKEAFLIAEMAGPLSEPYIRKLSGTMYKPGTVRRSPSAQTQPKPETSPQPKPVKPAEVPKFTPEDLLKEFKDYKGLLKGLGR